MRHNSVIPDRAPDNPMRGRILGAAFHAFVEDGYEGTSTLDIARRAKVSKRDLYAHFGSKQEMLVACIKSRADRMRSLPDLPAPPTRPMLAATLTAFATKLVRESSDPHVIATFRLAIAEATRSPEIAEALDEAGRDAARAALAGLLANAQAAGLIGSGNPTEMAMQYLGLLWEGLMVGLLLGVAKRPGPAEAERRAAKATDAFLRLHAAPGVTERGCRAAVADRMARHS
ncbi:MAG: TetR/AcrR family transcriptional regulator C-terminal domain-containing protein [Alphaproteobacteria bacterium]|nr:TetR/AcrR family transcriptional regulator C-terminal domain-containing protein [Alphaproteobacteria bacterium]MBV9018715.1 TetR/AcrR family transcriptional regulator C-terminal domain-containing protein [Alphaproteobacteria bacterium]